MNTCWIVEEPRDDDGSFIWGPFLTAGDAYQWCADNDVAKDVGLSIYIREITK